MQRSHFTANEPWVLAKQLRTASDRESPEFKAAKERLDAVLYLAIHSVRISGASRLFTNDMAA